MDSKWLKENFPELKGKYFGMCLDYFQADKNNAAWVREWIDKNVPKQIPLQPSVMEEGGPEMNMFLDSGQYTPPDETNKNWLNVFQTLGNISVTPTVRQIAVMPDACPTGPTTVPVGSVIKAENAIHPGWHSADICCSLMVTNLGVKDKDLHDFLHPVGKYPCTNITKNSVLDAVNFVTHFGPGGRPNGQRFTISPRLYEEARNNKFLKSTKSLQLMQEHLGTQGDGNHFAYVGTLESTGEICLVTHHGSRGFGALLYKEGMKVAERYRKEISPNTAKENAWIPFDTEDGRVYWEALQIVRKWTKANHNSIHQATCDALNIKHVDRFWNEHNFVFKDGNDFYHAKGATPVHSEYMPDSDGRTIIPMNMAEPILIAERGDSNIKAMGFAPHGAGRLLSRTKHIKKQKEAYSEEDHNELAKRVMDDETKGLDIRFYSGIPDVSELPSAYKDANQVQAEIEKYNLCNVVDRIMPHGCIMAGDCEKDAPWRKKRG